MKSLFTRCSDNPLLVADDLPFEASAVYNPGATEFQDEVILLVRVEDRKGFSNIHVARSKDGISGWKVEPEPLLAHGEPGLRYEQLGCEDARVTYVPEDDCYYV